jgi:hypothetical protein
MGAMFAPAQIQNWFHPVESRSASGSGSMPCRSNSTISWCYAAATRILPGRSGEQSARAAGC